MASSGGDLKPIQLLIAPLVIYTKTGLSSFSGPNTALSPLRCRAILQIQHWAFQIDDTCYEVTSAEDEARPGRRVYGLKISSAEAWWTARRQARVQVEVWTVGQTRMSKPELRREARYIWQNYHQSRYTVHDRNCQSFCYLFEKRINVASANSSGDHGIWRFSGEMPEPVSHALANGSRKVLVLGPPTAAHLALGTIPIITSYTGPSIPGKAVVGTKLAVAGKTTAATKTVVGTKAAVGSLGATKATAIGAGSAKAAIAAAAAGTATAVGTSHATLCGVGTAHAIAFGSGVATVGKGLTVLHPLVGAAAIGVGAACIKLAKKSDKRWLREHGKESL